MKRIKKHLVNVTLAIAVLLNLPFTALAGTWTEADVIQSYVIERAATVFTKAKFLPGDLKCTISNQNAEITAAGALSDEQALTKTTVLVDISTSMPKAIRSSVISVIKKAN